MKSLQLTEEQRDKVVDMCRGLFPEYLNVYFRVDSKSSVIYPNDHEVDNNILRIGSFAKKVDLSIHWFEFCMTYVWNALSLLNPTTSQKNLDELFIVLVQNKIHIVDYLYIEYEKL